MNFNKFQHTFHFDQIAKNVYIDIDNNNISDDGDDIFDESSNFVNCYDYFCHTIYN